YFCAYQYLKLENIFVISNPKIKKHDFTHFADAMNQNVIRGAIQIVAHRHCEQERWESGMERSNLVIGKEIASARTAPRSLAMTPRSARTAPRSLAMTPRKESLRQFELHPKLPGARQISFFHAKNPKSCHAKCAKYAFLRPLR